MTNNSDRIFSSHATIQQTENVLIKQMLYLNQRSVSEDTFDEKAFATAWNKLMAFWSEKKKLAVKNRLPVREVQP